MAHEVEKMVYKGEVPWHGLGTPLTGTESFQQILQLAGLDWTASARSLYLHARGADGVSVMEKSEDSKIIVRDSDGQQLGTVGADYKVIQHTDSMRKLVEPFIQSGKVEIESAGALRNGRIVWMLAKLKEGVADVTPGDVVKAYLLYATSHDGSRASATSFTNTRVVCANTLAAADMEGGTQMRIRHRGDVDAATDLVAQTLNLARQGFDATIEQYKALSQLEVNKGDLEKYFRLVFNVPEETKAEDSRLIKRLTEIFETAEGQQLAGENMWGAYNAVTHYLTHERGNTRDGRLSSLWLGASNLINKKALTLALEPA